MTLLARLQKQFLLVSALLAVAHADVSHLIADNSLDGYYYPQPVQQYSQQDGYVYEKPVQR